jgi:hypothetical protein
MARECFTRSMALPDKRRVHEAFLAHLNDVLQLTATTAEQTRRDATHAEAKPENDKDTRALEQSYLARGHAMRTEDLIEQREFIRFMELKSFGPDDALGAGALLRLDSEEGSRCIFMAAYSGGTELDVDGTKVLVVTPASPLGTLLVGRMLGDGVEQRVRGVLREYEISEVA